MLDTEGRVIREPGKPGRIVATGLDNKVMPLIRYDTGDWATISEIERCECGFVGTTFKRIEGRGEDIIFLDDGTQVSARRIRGGIKRIMRLKKKHRTPSVGQGMESKPHNDLQRRGRKA